MDFSVDQIDHVELVVPDRYEAAAWYRKTFGLRIISEFEFWAEDLQGPLMIATPSGGTKLALFTGNPVGSCEGRGFHLVAFRVGVDQFLNFINKLSDLRLRDQHGQAVSGDSVKDHQLAFSIYFCDPYGNQFELTTYDYHETKTALPETL